VLEEHEYKLANYRGMYNLILFVLADEPKQIKVEIGQKKISVIFSWHN